MNLHVTDPMVDSGVRWRFDHSGEGRSSAPITSNQRNIHRQLTVVVVKHLQHQYRRPLAHFCKTQFDQVDRIVHAHGGPLILDSGCGNGAGARVLARKFPKYLVIGIDKSLARLTRAERGERLDNLHFVRADCVDIWRLARQAEWPIVRHFVLYPNPWPKAKHLQRRWHGHPVFGSLVALGGLLELRSNWDIYIAEFAAALEIAGVDNTDIKRLKPLEPMTAFERKYLASGHALHSLRVQL